MEISNHGHLSFVWEPKPPTSVDVITLEHDVFPAASTNTEDNATGSAETTCLTKSLFTKMHLHVAHCDLNSTRRLCRLGNLTFGNNLMQEWLGKCPCNRRDRIPQIPVVSKHIPSFPGQILCVDISFPVENIAKESPSLVMICPLARYVVCKFLRNLRPLTIIAVVLSCWVSVFGYPEMIRVDKGTPFAGSDWADFLDAYSITTSQAPKEAANQIGVCERHSGFLKLSFQAVRRMDPETWDNNMIMSIATAAHNSTPLSGCGLPPLFLLTGNNVVERWGNNTNDHAETPEESTAEMFHQRQKAMTVARDSIMRITARQTIANAKNRQLRTGASDIFLPGQKIFCWTPSVRRWTDGFRVLSDAGRILIVEASNKLIKVPRNWAMISGPDRSRPNFSPRSEDPGAPPDGEHAKDDSNQLISPNEDAQGSADAPTDVADAPEKYVLRSGESYSKTMHASQVINHKEIYAALRMENTSEETNVEQTTANAPGEGSDINVFGFDPSRLHPRFFTTLISARHAIREEIFGLLRKPTGGLPALQIIDYSNPMFRSIPRIHTTLLVKLKAGSKMKARLVLRGDQEPILRSNFVSSPTTGRELLKIAASAFVNNDTFCCCSIDISQAFTQADLLSESERVIALCPNGMVLDETTWKGGLIPDPHCDLVGELESPPGLDEIFKVESAIPAQLETCTRTKRITTDARRGCYFFAHSMDLETPL